MDVLTTDQRRKVMASNGGKNTTPERYIHHLAEAAGLLFRKHDSSLPGKPDLSFVAEQLAVFVDGDFWHGWRFPVWRHRLAPFWEQKIDKNRKRDQRNFRRLRRMGWRVLRIWEHEVEENVVACVTRLSKMLGGKINRRLLEAAYAELPPLKRRRRLPKP